MEDLISRQAVLDVVEREQFKGDAISEIEKLPPVNPQPKTGHWIVHEIESTLKWLECSNCHCETSYKVMYNYCPNCSAKMEVSE